MLQGPNVSLTAAASQFPLFHPAVYFILPGARTAWQVEENVKNFNNAIPKKLWVETRGQYLILSNALFE